MLDSFPSCFLKVTPYHQSGILKSDMTSNYDLFDIYLSMYGDICCDLRFLMCDDICCDL